MIRPSKEMQTLMQLSKNRDHLSPRKKTKRQLNRERERERESERERDRFALGINPTNIVKICTDKVNPNIVFM